MLDLDVVVNGNPVTLQSSLGASLLQALRNAGFLSPKAACEEGRCGSCSLLHDGEVVYACLVPAAACEGAAITTVEGGVSHDLTEALIGQGAVQCGFCTTGFVMTIEALLQRHAEQPLDDQAIRAGLGGNLCRCTGYEGIVAAVLEVHQRRLQGTSNESLRMIAAK